ncbi:SRPBCC family protein [Bradyrhizobium sp.]
MSEIIIAIAVILALAIAAVLILASRKPDTLRVQRTAAIHAPPEKIFALIGDFRAWRAWSPYEDRDPDLQRSYSGADSGRGAVYEWNGNRQVGSGRMEILDAPAPSKVVIKLDFLKPFEAHNTAEFTFVPQGDTTNVTWLMHGPAPLMSKVMQVFMNMDNMIGKDFATGLANLKRITEK